MDASTVNDTSPPEDQAKGFVMSRGMKFPKDDNFIRGRIRGSLKGNRYETKETEAVLRVVREGDVVVELGAGIGYMSTLVASKRKIKSVHAFEANPNLIPYIKSVHEANGLTKMPLEGDTEETTQKTKVEVLNAKTVFKDLQPTVLICDIEGAEADLIPQLDLSGLRAAVIETHPQWIGPEGINKVFRAFMDAGLAYYHRGSVNKVISLTRCWTACTKWAC